MNIYNDLVYTCEGMIEMKDMYRSMLMGVAAGVVFSLAAFFVNLEIEGFLLWLIPFFSGILSALGAVVAAFTSKAMQEHGFQNEAMVSGLGFVAAALINCMIVLVALALVGAAPLHRNVILALFLGLAFGGIYGIYSFRVARIKERMDFLQALADKNTELQEAARLMAINAERNRMSRELHDSVSQGLHGIMFSLRSLRAQIDENQSPRAWEILDHLEASARSTQEELRSLIHELRPSVLAEKGLEEAIQHLADMVSQRRKIPVHIQLEPMVPLPAGVEMAIYRIVQEALSNSERHSKAGNVTIQGKEEGTVVKLVIEDDGIGFDTGREALGYGLDNMRRRAEENGLHLTITSLPGKGTCVTAVFNRAIVETEG